MLINIKYAGFMNFRPVCGDGRFVNLGFRLGTGDKGKGAWKATEKGLRLQRGSM